MTKIFHIRFLAQEHKLMTHKITISCPGKSDGAGTNSVLSLTNESATQSILSIDGRICHTRERERERQVTDRCFVHFYVVGRLLF